LVITVMPLLGGDDSSQSLIKSQNHKEGGNQMQKMVVKWQYEGEFQERVCLTERDLDKAIAEARKVGARFSKRSCTNGNGKSRSHGPSCRRSSPRRACRF